jgi:hypothetical protein
VRDAAGELADHLHLLRLPELLLEVVPLGHVAADPLEGHRVSGLVADDAQARLDPRGRPVLPQQPVHDRLRDVAGPGDERLGRRAVVRVDDPHCEPGVCVELLPRVAGDALDRGVHVLEPGLGPEPVTVDRVGRTLGEPAETLLALGELPLDLAEFRHVERDRAGVHAVLEQRVARERDADVRAVARDEVCDVLDRPVEAAPPSLCDPCSDSASTDQSRSETNSAPHLPTISPGA